MTPRDQAEGRVQADRGGAATRERILHAAIELYSERGYSAVSIRDLARSVGIKESSIYNHFAGKDAILEAIYDLVRERMLSREVSEEQIDALLDRIPAGQFFHQAFDAYVDAMTDKTAVRLWRILIVEQFRDPRADALYNDEIRAELHANTALALERMRQRGLIRDVDPQAVAVVQTESIKSLLFSYVSRPAGGAEAFRQATHRIIDFVWEAIRA